MFFPHTVPSVPGIQARDLNTRKQSLVMDECIALVLKFSNTSHHIKFKEVNSE